jgi:3-isopropylmalate dehydrogenase
MLYRHQLAASTLVVVVYASVVLSFLTATTTTLAFGPQLHRSFGDTRSSSSSSSSATWAVSKRDSYQITVFPGDGIGPEITAATKHVLSALCERCGFTLTMTDALIGGAAIDAVNDPFPPQSLQQCLASDSVLLACIGGYKWDTNPRELRPESGLLRMRSTMGLFANLRPAKVLPQLVDASTLKREVVEGVDLMVVRELTGDVYFGTPKGIDVIDGTFRLALGTSGQCVFDQ